MLCAAFLETHRDGLHAVEEKSHQSKIFGFPSDRTTYKNWEGDEQGDAAGYQPILGPRL